MTEISIRELNLGDEPRWRSLWNQFLSFNEVELPADVTQSVWDRLHACDVATYGVVAEAREGGVVGMMHYVLHPHTWSDRTVCYLEDLFVDPEQRGVGTGRKMIEALADLAREHGWSRVYWHTTEDNDQARRLYDKLADLTPHVRYAIEFEPE